MKTTQIMIRYDAATLKDLEYYLPQNGTTVEEELKNRLDEIYKNQVPDSVKEFIRFQSGNKDLIESQTEKMPEPSEDATESGKSSRRQKSISPKAELTSQTDAPALIQTM